MKFSIITVCKNSEKTVENAILNVAAQTCKDYEHIIIDGLSTDNTLNIIEQNRDKIAKLISESDSGLYDAMNKGIKMASGDYLLFLNSDDELFDSEVLQKVSEKMQNTPEVLYGDIIVVNKEADSSSLQKHNKLNKIYLLKNTPCQPATFYRRDCFEKYGYFDVNYKIVSDHEWFLRVFLKHKISCEYLGFAINKFSTGGLSTSAKREKLLNQERNDILDKYFTKFERISFEFISKYCRSLTYVPMISDILNIIFRFKL